VTSSAEEAAAVPLGDDDLSAMVRAYVWGVPLVLAARLRQNMTLNPPPTDTSRSRSAAAPLNTFGHQRLLSDATYRVGVAPNVDTLYSVAWVDLADGPVVLDAPDAGDRYYTFQVGFADSSSLAVGQRTHGSRLPPVILRREGARPPAVTGLHLTSPTRYAMFAGRILVDTSTVGDLDRVHRLQDGVHLTRWQEGSKRPTTVSEQRPLDSGTEGLAEGPAFFRRLANVLLDWESSTVPPEVLADLRRGGFDHELRLERTVDPVQLQRAVEVGSALVEQGVRTAAPQRNGWAVNDSGSRFGDDWLLRAAVASSAIYVNPVEEALYAVAELDAEGCPLTGNRRYEIRFPPHGLPPVSYFWSLTMYHDAGFLVDNPLDRHAIGDRSPGLHLDADGGLVIQVSHPEPASCISNWLPAPPGGFRLIMRLYGPTRACLDGGWSPPTIRTVAIDEQEAAP
jgi:hypothetical protein